MALATAPTASQVLSRPRCGLGVLDITDDRWARFVERVPGALPFHHPSWARLLADCYGHRSLALVLEDDEGVAAGIPAIEIRTLFGTRWISLPFTDATPPLARDERVVATFIAELDAVRKQNGILQLEIRAAVAGTNIHQQPAGFLHTLRLASDPAKVFRTFKRSHVQQRILKAEREGVTVRRATSKPDLTRTFYDLHLETRRRLGVPIQPRRYFELLWERIIEPGHGFVLLAHWRATPIAAAVFLAGNGTLTYKYSASRQKFWNFRPNNLVLWEAIRWGCENGFHTFDFGRTEPGNEGLRSFKRGWGTTEVALRYSTLSETPPSQARLRAAEMLRWPIQRMPTWFCRVVGELAYGSAA